MKMVTFLGAMYAIKNKKKIKKNRKEHREPYNVLRIQKGFLDNI